MTLALYELGGLNDLVCYSLFSWRARMRSRTRGYALIRPVRVSDKAAIAFSGQDKVPILKDGEEMIGFLLDRGVSGSALPGPAVFGGRSRRRSPASSTPWSTGPRSEARAAVHARFAGRRRRGSGALRARSRRLSANRIRSWRPTATRTSRRFRRMLDPVRASLRSQPSSQGHSRPMRTTSCSVRCNGRASSRLPSSGTGRRAPRMARRMLDLDGGLGAPRRAGETMDWNETLGDRVGRLSREAATQTAVVGAGTP